MTVRQRVVGDTIIYLCNQIGTGDEHVVDNYGRPHLQKWVPKDMCCFLRPVRDMKGELGCQTYRHVRDIEETWLSLPAAERPEYLILSLDNGDWSDPT